MPRTLRHQNPRRDLIIGLVMIGMGTVSAVALAVIEDSRYPVTIAREPAPFPTSVWPAPCSETNELIRSGD
jgi:hypothetical protein